MNVFLGDARDLDLHHAVNETSVNCGLLGQSFAGRAFGGAPPELWLVGLPDNGHGDGFDDFDPLGGGGALGDAVAGPRTQRGFVGDGAAAESYVGTGTSPTCASG